MSGKKEYPYTVKTGEKVPDTHGRLRGAGEKIKVYYEQYRKLTPEKEKEEQ